MKKRRPPPDHSDLPEAFQGTSPPARIVQWADDLLRNKDNSLPRLFRFTAGRLESWLVREVYGGSADREMTYAAACVLARTVGPGAWVGVYGPYRLPLKPDGSGGESCQMLFAQAVDDAAFGARWDSHRGAGVVLTRCSKLTLESAEQLGDFFDPAATIEPAFERRLATGGLPGARTVAEARPATAALDLLRPPVEVPYVHAPAEKEPPPWELEAVMAFAAEIESRTISPYALLPAVFLPVLQTRQNRPLADRIAHAGSRNALLDAVMRGTIERRAVELDPAVARLDDEARALGLAALAAGNWGDLRRTHGLALGLELAALVERTWPEPEPAPLVPKLVPSGLAIGDEHVVTRTALLVLAHHWRAIAATHEYCVASGDDEESKATHAARGLELDARIEQLSRLHDALLDRAGAPPGPFPDRLARAIDGLLGSFGPLGTYGRVDPHVLQRAVLRSDLGPEPLVRAHMVYQATQVRMMHFRVLFVRAPEDYAAEEHDPRGLFGTEHDEYVGALIRLAGDTALDGPADKLAAAERFATRAYEISRSAVALGARNELRFARGERASILGDLLEEAKVREKSLAPAAEALACARETGDSKATRKAAEWVLGRSRGTPHAWIGEARARLARPRAQRLGDLERLLSVEGSIPGELDRAARALWGSRGSEIRAELDALAAWLRAAESPPEPHVVETEAEPSAPADRAAEVDADAWAREADGLERAVRALRARLDRPRMAHAPQKPRLEVLVRGARSLDDPAAARAWFGAAASLAAALDLYLRAGVGHDGEEVALLEEAIGEAERALAIDAALAWRARARAQASAALAVAGSASQLDRARRVLERVASADADEKESLDAELAAILESAQLEVEGEEREADARAVMRVPEQAIDRSVRELGTPAWAIAEGLRQVMLFSLAEGRRDQKALKGTRDERGVLWELRAHRRHLPVRVFFRRGADGAEVVAILAKEDDEQQRRVIERVRGW